MDKNKKHKSAIAVTAGGIFKNPYQPSIPPRISSSMQQRMEAITTSASSGGQPQYNPLNQISPGTSSQFDSLHIDSGSGKKKNSKK